MAAQTERRRRMQAVVTEGSGVEVGQPDPSEATLGALELGQGE